ncbi:hypothetical protein M6B38_374455 [Iris pallida]|uniref:Uncharacterized protein n=1 Tax=Iris pallida TaxID=29817 RepID=A0AAX6GB75_IRIPA|nr:hypothetical protein M6B38_105650 [Iris pallida]KAJ6826006.1 hypothetical protein M6B38_374455 [Iris pallida]
MKRWKKKSTAIEENLSVNDWDIYREVTIPSHGRVLGLGGGLKGKDLYSSGQSCNKRRCVEREENHQQLKDELKDVKGQLSTLQEQVQMLLNNIQNSDHSARQSPYADNVGSNGSDANLSDDVEE